MGTRQKLYLLSQNKIYAQSTANLNQSHLVAYLYVAPHHVVRAVRHGWQPFNHECDQVTNTMHE